MLLLSSGVEQTHHSCMRVGWAHASIACFAMSERVAHVLLARGVSLLVNPSALLTKACPAPAPTTHDKH